MQTQPLVSAVILNYRTPQDAVECVKALRAQTIADPSVPANGRAGQLEILVVDNHSEDDSIGVLRNRVGAFSDVRILESPVNAGFGGGYDIGIRQAKGEYLFINNPVKKLQPDGLENMIRRIEADPGIGILAPKLVHDDGSVRTSARAYPHLWDIIVKRTALQKWFPKSLERYLQKSLSADEERDTDWVIGGCFLIRADFMRELHGFDPRFFLFFEDIDLCRRCWAAGKRVVYFPQVSALDRKRRLSDMHMFLLPLRKTGREHIKSAIKYFWKWRTL